MASIFTKIIAREIPADILYEDDVCLAFVDISPQAPTHFLVIPKKEIVSLAELCDEDEQIIGRCIMVASKVAATEGLDFHPRGGWLPGPAAVSTGPANPPPSTRNCLVPSG